MHAHRLSRLLFVFSFSVVLTLIAASGAAARTVPEDASFGAQNTNIALAHQTFAVFNGADADIAALLIDDDAEIVTPHGTYTGPEGLIAYVQFLKILYQDAEFDITSVAATGDAIVVTWRMNALEVRLEPVDRVPAIGVEVTGSSTLTVENDQVASISHVYDEVTYTSPTTQPDVAGVFCGEGPCP